MSFGVTYRGKFTKAAWWTEASVKCTWKNPRVLGSLSISFLGRSGEWLPVPTTSMISSSRSLPIGLFFEQNTTPNYSNRNFLDYLMKFTFLKRSFVYSFLDMLPILGVPIWLFSFSDQMTILCYEKWACLSVKLMSSSCVYFAMESKISCSVAPARVISLMMVMNVELTTFRVHIGSLLNPPGFLQLLPFRAVFPVGASHTIFLPRSFCYWAPFTLVDIV